MLRIAHLSDIHLDAGSLIDAEKFVVKALINDLIEFNKDKQVDIVIISGDLIDKGGKSFEDTRLAFIAFDDLLIKSIEKDLNINRNRIFITPGNHDIVRDMDDIIDEEGLKSLLIDTPTVNSYIESGNTKGRKRLEIYNEYLNSFYNKKEADCIITDFQSTFAFDTLYGKLGIACFNSAWRCYSNEDINNILLGERQIVDARDHLKDCPIKIAVLHHPLDWFKDFESKAVQAFIGKDYNMIFCGHTHQGSSWSKSDFYGSTFVSVSPSNWTYNIRTENRTNSNGYSIVDYDLKNRVIKVHNRRYCYLKEKYDPNSDLGNDIGVSIHQIPSSKELEDIFYETDLCNNIKNIHTDGMNRNLLSSYTDTKAPKTIDEIFILPKIVNKVDFTTGTEESVEYDIDKICSTEINTIVFGIKESGKTTLLYKILMNYVDNIERYRKIPVFIDFEELGHKDYETVISHYLSIKILDVPKFIIEHKVIMLIDNLKFGSGDVIKLRKLSKLLETYENISVISTCLHVVEGEIPLEYLDNTFYRATVQLTINSFKTRHIKELTEKWFSKNDDFSEPIKLDKLLAIILPLNLPRTPLAISMFLWIIEQQENYKPINQATMLENFVERLFHKQSKDEIYSETFDYKNKERLLADIAYAMYEKTLPNYRILLSDVLAYVAKRLSLKKFEFPTSENVLHHFLAKGILIKEVDGLDTYIRFRFSCFFQYFLMKKVEFDEEFRKFVFDSKNYLSFCNEIDYYTGIKRDKSDILIMLIERMISAYEDLNGKINDLEYSYDTVFDVKQSLTSSLDGNYVKKLRLTGKPSEKEIDYVTDEMLEKAIPEKGIDIKEQKIDKIVELERLWVLSSKVLKNTEETDVPDLKSSAYKQIVICSIAYSNLYKVMLLDYLKKNVENISAENKEKYTLINKALPLLHQLVLHTTMGTAKLSQVIREKIDNDDKTLQISDFEKYISIFLYADIRGADYIHYIKRFIKTIKHQYIYDMTLFKIVSYYHLRSKTKDTDLLYEDMIAELITRSKKLGRGKKATIMLNYRSQKGKQKKTSSE